MIDNTKAKIDEEIVLSKYEGDPVPENEFERMHILNGKVVAVHKIVDGEIVDSVFAADSDAGEVN